VTRISVLELVASSRGGGAVHVRDLTLGLDPAHFAVQVGMAEDGGTVGREDLAVPPTTRDAVADAGIPFYPLELAAGFSLAAIRQLRRLLPGVDILHVHGARAALFGRLAAWSLGGQRPRVVYSIHGFAAPHYPVPRRQVLLAVEKALAAVTDLWICVSHAEKEALLTAGVADAGRTHVVWNGIDLQRFAAATVRAHEVRLALGVSTDSFLVTTICRLFRPRDFPTLLAAFSQVHEKLPHAHLWIVGDGPLRPQIEESLATLHLEGSVHLLGMRRDVPQILRATDVLVLSSKGWEGLPLTVLEAMASSLPVVASDVGGTREAVVDGETGLLFPPLDVTALVRHILTLAADPALAQRMGRRGQARVQEFFTLQRMARETAALYEQLVPTVSCDAQVPPNRLART